MFERIEATLLCKVSGYEILGNVLKRFSHDKSSFPPVLVDLYLPSSSVFGLIMDENEDGTLTVFVPAAPALTVGMVHVVSPDRITRLEAGVTDVTGCVSRWRLASRRVLAESGS